MRGITIGILASLAMAAPISAQAADGVLTGFGNVPFGSRLDAARVAAGVEVREESCTDNTCQLVYRTTVVGLAATVWQQFTDGAAGRAELLIRSTATGGGMQTSRIATGFSTGFLACWRTATAPPTFPSSCGTSQGRMAKAYSRFAR